MAEVLIASLSIVSALLIFAFTQRTAAHDRQRETYAKALSLVEKWKEVPYRVLRHDRDGHTYDVVNLIHDLQEETAFYDSWIQFESEDISQAYQALIFSVKKQSKPHIQTAWDSEKPPSQNVGNRYPVDVSEEERAYVEAVRRHFEWYGILKNFRRGKVKEWSNIILS